MHVITAQSEIALVSPLISAIVVGFLGRYFGRILSYCIAISFAALSLWMTSLIYLRIFPNHIFNEYIYTWANSGNISFKFGIMLDRLSISMMLVVIFISLLVHFYSIGYMKKDPDNQRFVSYISLFTFFMLLLVSSNNLFQLFFGWEGVSLVSYLLIGFWFKKESAIFGSFKSFIVNRVGDFCLILGLAALLESFKTLDYISIFSNLDKISSTSIRYQGISISLPTVICILIFIGTIGKSAQIPLHIWLPESMEGPTPISALIHAATMVTAGVFLVARMSPLFGLCTTVLSIILLIGSSSGLFLGLLAVFEYDLKRILAYSTMSQLGYMMAANGVSDFNAGVLHLLTHAFFKALLFLSAGAIITAMDHEQDIRYMGNLKKRMPFTYMCFASGALALCAIPPLSGYYSKDSIIESVRISSIPGSHYAYLCLLIGSFVTGFYIFRALFAVFHKNSYNKQQIPVQLKKIDWTMLLPMGILLLPTHLCGSPLADVIFFRKGHQASDISELFKYRIDLMSITALPVLMALLGIACAYILVVINPTITQSSSKSRILAFFRKMIINQYWMESVNNLLFVSGTQKVSKVLSEVEEKIVDRFFIVSFGSSIMFLSRFYRRIQNGYIRNYIFCTIFSLTALLMLSY